MAAENGGSRRLFLALWPGEEVRRSLTSFQQRCLEGGRVRRPAVVPARNLHITLHFIGRVPGEAADSILRALDTVSTGAFTLTLDRYGLFRRNGIVWLGARECPGGLADLLQKTAACIEPQVHLQPCRRYLPHVTLLRKAFQPCGVEITEPLEWHVDAFAMVESVTHPEGAQYAVLKEWRLSG